jgi:hypothetical protein
MSCARVSEVPAASVSSDLVIEGTISGITVDSLRDIGIIENLDTEILHEPRTIMASKVPTRAWTLESRLEADWRSGQGCGDGCGRIATTLPA